VALDQSGPLLPDTRSQESLEREQGGQDRKRWDGAGNKRGSKIGSDVSSTSWEPGYGTTYDWDGYAFELPSSNEATFLKFSILIHGPFSGHRAVTKLQAQLTE